MVVEIDVQQHGNPRTKRGLFRKLGGPEAPVQGDIGGTTVSVEKVGDNGIRETYHRGGKVVSVATSTLGADGKLSVVSENKMNGSTLRYEAAKG